MGKHTAYSLMEIRLFRYSDPIAEVLSDLCRDGIAADVSGIVGPLQYEVDQTGRRDVVDAVLRGVNLGDQYVAATKLLPPGWLDRTVSVYALVQVVWLTDDTPEGYFEECDFKLAAMFQQNELQVALLAMLPKDGPK